MWEPQQPWFAPEYVSWMSTLPCPVFMLEPIPAIPTSVAYPKNEIMDMFGQAAVYFFTSSLAWMMALAIAQKPDEIGLWGVDMSASEEIYSGQRAGCQYWIGKARELGIKVTLPPQSDLAVPTPLYGFNEQQHQHQKLLARKAELIARLNAARNTANAAQQEATYLQGAAEDVDYILKTWIADPKAAELLSRFDTHVGLPRLSAVLVSSGSEPVPLPEPVIEASPGRERIPLGYGAAFVDAMVSAAPEPRRPIEDIIANVTGRTEVAPPTPLTWGSTPLPDFINGIGA